MQETLLVAHPASRCPSHSTWECCLLLVYSCFHLWRLVLNQWEQTHPENYTLPSHHPSPSETHRQWVIRGCWSPVSFPQSRTISGMQFMLQRLLDKLLTHVKLHRIPNLNWDSLSPIMRNALIMTFHSILMMLWHFKVLLTLGPVNPFRTGHS